MSIARTRALRSLQSSLRHTGARATPRVSAPSRTQLAVGRRYASGGSGHAEPSSDLPWMLGGVVVTIPACYYLWPSSTSHAEHGGHADHEDHAEETHDEKEEAPQEEETPSEESEKPSHDPEEAKPIQDSAGKSEEPSQKEVQQNKADSQREENKTQGTSKADEKAKESEETAKPSGSQGEAQPMGSDANKQSSRTEVGSSKQKETPEHGGNTEGAQFKGHMKSDSPGMQDNRKREPDSKGGYKNRIDSGLGKNLGAGPTKAEDGTTDAASTAKTPDKSEGSISGKQMGLTNTATRHSEDITHSDDKSTKGEGVPETAKSMGTVDVNRPQK